MNPLSIDDRIKFKLVELKRWNSGYVHLWIWQSYIKWEYEENWNPKYPFHRWLWWKTGNIWLVIEKY
jgi:hypothetical protein